jgi:hypothetical protein
MIVLWYFIFSKDLILIGKMYILDLYIIIYYYTLIHAYTHTYIHIFFNL